MIDGFIRVAAVTSELRVADCEFNAGKIREASQAAAEKGARIIVFPELSLTGCSCGDLFLDDLFVESAKNALIDLVQASAGREEIVVVGLPVEYENKLFNAAAVFSDGDLLGLVPKMNLNDSKGFCESRYFSSEEEISGYISLYQPEKDQDDEDVGNVKVRPMPLNVSDFINQQEEDDDEIEIEVSFEDDDDIEHFEYIPFGSNLIFRCDENSNLCFAIEIGSDIKAPFQPAAKQAAAGAVLILNPTASAELVGESESRELMLRALSEKLICSYISANAGPFESSSEAVFSGFNLICENGSILSKSKPFSYGTSGTDTVLADVDYQSLVRERRTTNTFKFAQFTESDNEEITFTFSEEDYSELENVRPLKGHNKKMQEKLFRSLSPYPFLPSDINDEEQRTSFCEEILNIQAAGLMRRQLHTKSNKIIIGLSGGLDSSIALLAAKRTCESSVDKPSVLALTMPGPGTTEKTKARAIRLCKAVGIELTEIDITDSFLEHLKSIDHDPSEQTLVYENAQARIRTLVLMDLANKHNGIVVGTGDLLEIALGWATYGGDHLSMYGLNAGIPKTVIKYILNYVSDTSAENNLDLSSILLDILNAPITPELQPADGDEPVQLTEDLIGPYELHDFFLYHMLRHGRKPGVIFELAKIAFSNDGAFKDRTNETDKADTAAGSTAALLKDSYTEKEILKYMRVFYKRFFQNQFKRNAMPDGPAVYPISLSPHGFWKMPSDAEVTTWLTELDKLTE